MTDFLKIPDGLDDGHVHEVVDRLHVVICTIEGHVSSHPLVEAIPSLKDKIDRAVSILADAYQEAGAVGFVAPRRRRDDCTLCTNPGRTSTSIIEK